MMVVGGYVVLALIWIAYDKQYPSEEMIQVRWGRSRVTRRVRMKRSNHGKINGQHVRSNSSKAATICRKGRDQKIRNNKHVLCFLAPEEQDGLLRMKPPCSFKN